jgi:enamine deaminase RidA (YjgF/YER057c/UK114 family)
VNEAPRVRVSSGTVWEQKVGYSRAVRVGDAVHVSGTTATTRDGGFVGEGDPYAQTRQILDNIGWALAQVGSSLSEVVRCRIYVVREQDWQEVGRALGDVFGQIRPANTLVGTPWLVDPRMLVEIDADAIIGSALTEN